MGNLYGLFMQMMQMEQTPPNTPSFTQGSKNFATFYESITEPVLTGTEAVDLSGEVFVAVPGRNVEFLQIFARGTTAPAFTDTEVTFSSGNASWSAPSGWYKLISQIPAEDTGTLWLATETAGVLGDGTDTVTWDEGTSIVDQATVDSSIESALATTAATTGSFSTNISSIPGAGGTIAVPISANVDWYVAYSVGAHNGNIR